MAIKRTTLREQVQEALKKEVLENYKTGDLLPGQRQLAEKLGVSVVTIREAIQSLVDLRLVERHHGKGTIVRKPKATLNIALLFGDSLVDETAHFYRAILRRFQETAAEKNWSCSHYDRLNSQMFSEAVSDSQKEALLADHRQNPYSGVIEFSPGEATITPKDLIGHLPTACFGISSMHADLRGESYHFGFESVRQLAAKGCRKIFYFCSLWHTHKSSTSIDGVLDAAREFALPTPEIHYEPIFEQGYRMERQMFERVSELTRKWASAPGGQPDGLIFNDDVVLRAVCPAVLQAGRAIPSELKVICQGNEDVRFYYGFPVIRYELSPKRIVQHLLSILEKKINGESAEPGPFAQSGTLYFET